MRTCMPEAASWWSIRRPAGPARSCGSTGPTVRTARSPSPARRWPCVTGWSFLTRSPSTTGMLVARCRPPKAAPAFSSRSIPIRTRRWTCRFLGHAVSPKGDAVYLTGTASPGSASPSPTILRYDPVSGAAHLIESAAFCDARAEGSCAGASCPCGGLIDFLPSPDGATVYVLRDPVPGPFIQHAALVTVDAMSGTTTATIELGDVAPGIGRASGRFISLIDGRLLVAAHVEPLALR